MHAIIREFRSWIPGEQEKTPEPLKHYWQEAGRTLDKIEQLMSRPGSASFDEQFQLWSEFTCFVLAGQGAAPASMPATGDTVPPDLPEPDEAVPLEVRRRSVRVPTLLPDESIPAPCDLPRAGEAVPIEVRRRSVRVPDPFFPTD